MGTHVPANIKALAVGPIVSGLPRSKRRPCCRRLGPTCSLEKISTSPLRLYGDDQKVQGPGRRMLPPLVVSSPLSTLCSLSFPFHLHFLLSIFQHSRQITVTAPAFLRTKHALFIKFFGPLWPRCKTYHMISCFLSRSISTSQTSMLFN